MTDKLALWASIMILVVTTIFTAMIVGIVFWIITENIDEIKYFISELIDRMKKG